jgi:hypothetical protein
MILGMKINNLATLFSSTALLWASSKQGVGIFWLLKVNNSSGTLQSRRKPKIPVFVLSVVLQ